MKRNSFRTSLDFVASCYASLDLQEMQQNTLKSFHQALGIEHSIFYISNSTGNAIDFNNPISLGIDKAYSQQYASYYSRHDPMLDRALASKCTVFTTRDVVPDSEYMRTKYYNEFLKPQGQEREMAICLRNGTELLGMIFLLKHRLQSDFNHNDTETVRTLLPYIASAARNSRKYTKLMRDKDSISTLISAIPEGLLLVNYDLEPVHANPEAKRLCEILHELPDSSDTASGCDTEKTQLPTYLQQQCMYLKSCRQGTGQSLRELRRLVTTEDRKKVRLEISAVIEKPDTEASKGFIISLKDITGLDSDQTKEMVKDIYHLTNREVELVTCIIDGLTNNEIAQKMSLSKYTVETHLKHIFEKTQIRNRTELVKKLVEAGIVPA